jgi:hypothetical protein
MSRSLIARYVTPWVSKREKEQLKRIDALRRRDGDNCRRCRRPMRFDLPGGNDKAARIETITSFDGGDTQPLESLCLCHVRCNADSGDNTAEVAERVRRKSEAALFARPRKRARR